MKAGITFDAERQLHFFALAEAETPIVVILLEVKFFGPIERQRRHLG